jgi:hypothetical protein
VYSTFVNNSSDRFYFYKPLLPSDDLLKESVFDFEMETGAKSPIVIDFIDSSEGRYYEGTRKIAPCVIPDLKKDNFLSLGPGDSISFEINAARFYNFDGDNAKMNRDFTVAYVVAMPLINDKFEQVFEKDKGRDKRVKPVFYSIGLQRADPTDKYLYKRVAFTVNN